MRKILTALAIILTLISYGQKNKYRPFKLVVIKPDTAILERFLWADIDSVQSDYLKRYFYSIQQMENIANTNDFPKDSSFRIEQEKIKRELDAAKALEPEIRKFQYYQFLSSYSTEVYNFYFNEYEPFSTIVEFPNQRTDLTSLNKLADTSKADYIIFFSNVHTVLQNSGPVLKLTTSLYSKKNRKIILAKETEGDTDSRGDMWTCGSTILSCLLINGVRTSTNEVIPIIRSAQLGK